MIGEVIKNDKRNTIAISAKSGEEADKLFNGLSEGGKIEMQWLDGHFGAYFGMFADKYGIEWMVNFDPKK
jgi:PhnB protein